MKNLGLTVQYSIPSTDNETPELLEGISIVYDCLGVPMTVKHPITNEPMMNMATFLMISVEDELKYIPSMFCKKIDDKEKVEMEIANKKRISDVEN